MTAQVINGNKWPSGYDDTLYYFGIKNDQPISTNMKQSTTNTKYSSNINSNKAYQRKHQKSPIDVIIDNKIHGILMVL